MTERVPTTTEFASRSLRLDTLVRLRWLAVAGQTTAVLVIAGLGFPLPIVGCLVLIALSAVLNLSLRLRFRPTMRLDQWPALVLLAYDLAQLGGLLFLTGGLDNPFAILLLVPVIVSATTLPPRATVVLGTMVVATASILALYHLPLPWYADGNLVIPLAYTAGVWVALVLACAFTGIYTFRVAEEARQLARALTATEMVLAREHHLSALDGLAAAAAHELGTPLATIALVAKEMVREAPEGDPRREDLALIMSQSQRCREILGRLTTMSWQGDEHLARVPLSHLIEEVVAPYRGFSAEIIVAPASGEGPEPVGHRNPAVIQGLANLVENAVDFAVARVTIATEWDAGTVAVSITDDGPGFAPGIRERIGEPYVTTRGPRSAPADPEVGGLGLGFFIAKTLLERSGARLTLGNREAPMQGAIVKVVWPRGFMDSESRMIEENEEGGKDGMTWRRPSNPYRTDPVLFSGRTETTDNG